MVDDQALKLRVQNATTGFLNSSEKRTVANGASLLTFLKQGKEVRMRPEVAISEMVRRWVSVRKPDIPERFRIAPNVIYYWPVQSSRNRALPEPNAA
jgi:hypothetical protein